MEDRACITAAAAKLPPVRAKVRFRAAGQSKPLKLFAVSGAPALGTQMDFGRHQRFGTAVDLSEGSEGLLKLVVGRVQQLGDVRRNPPRSMHHRIR